MKIILHNVKRKMINLCKTCRMEFGLPIGTLIFCLSLTAGWFGNPIFYVWCVAGVVLIYSDIRTWFKRNKLKSKGEK